LTQNRVCAKFGIKHPIIQGAMLGFSKSRLVSAVSNAGGLGLLAGAMGPKALRDEIRKTKELTNKPFGVNIPVVMERRARACIELALEEGVRIFATAAGNPDKFTKLLKDSGAMVMHVVPSVRHALKAEAAGVDMVVAEGTEAGGLVGPLGVTTFILVPQVVDAVRVPIIAAGGIGNARGFVAALALGAEGVQMGTRFLATKECESEESLKQAILKATDTSTELRGGGTQRWRAFNEDFLKSALTDLRGIKGIQEVEAQIGDMLGDKDTTTEIEVKGVFGAGQVAGMITEVLSVEEVIRSMVEGAAEIAERMGRSLSLII
jgi:enoyl-[acyl-carrier protein] reductase II